MVLCEKKGMVKEQIESWQEFYKNLFGIEIDPNLEIPENRKGFNRLIVVGEGLTLNQVYDVCKNHFECCSSDEKVSHNDRESKKSYAIWVRQKVEADKELMDFSVNQLKEKGVKGITLLERMLYELKYFLETGRHLDRRSITLCAGSRYSDGHVPVVYWKRKLNIYWGFTTSQLGCMRVRAIA